MDTTNNTKPSANSERESPPSSLIKTIENRQEFENLLQTLKDKFIIVEFFAKWCGACKILAMKFQELAENYQEKLQVFKIDIDDLEELAIEYDVTVMPSFMIMKNGLKLEQYEGSKPEQFDNMVKKYLAKE
ncbi:thioredoxin-2-like [Cochliomyia hominivorax]